MSNVISKAPKQPKAFSNRFVAILGKYWSKKDPQEIIFDKGQLHYEHRSWHKNETCENGQPKDNPRRASGCL